MAKQRTGPVFLGNAAANIFQGGGGDATLRDTITHIRLSNETSAAATYSLWIGATGASTAGTSIAKDVSLDANKAVDLVMSTPLASTDFLVGKSNTANAIAVTVDRIREVI